MMNRLALIPCKALALGKSRLASIIGADERRWLCEEMLAVTIETAREIVTTDRIWVVTADECAGEIARWLGVGRLDDKAGELNSALEAARSWIVNERGRPSDIPEILILPIDLPFATAAAIYEFIDQDADVALASDIAGIGTNMIRLRGRSVLSFPFVFGTESLEAHRQAAIAGGHSLWVSRDRRLAFDLDEPRDLLALKETRGIESIFNAHL